MTERCPTCGHKVDSLFDHLDIECDHDMSEDEIKQLLYDRNVQYQDKERLTDEKN